MTKVLFLIGVAAGAILLCLLAATWATRSFRIWPTPGPGSWQSYVFWPLFRGLNVLCFAVAIGDRTPLFNTPAPVRIAAAALLAVSVALFVHAFRNLGRDQSYGARQGLVTGGIYRWSRNPQNAMLVVVYASLAVAADSAPATVLCLAMMAVYVLMVLVEESWLEAAYGEDYRRYCVRIPRFFNWRRAAIAAAHGARQWYRSPATNRNA